MRCICFLASVVVLMCFAVFLLMYVLILVEWDHSEYNCMLIRRRRQLVFTEPYVKETLFYIERGFKSVFLVDPI